MESYNLLLQSFNSKIYSDKLFTPTIINCTLKLVEYLKRYFNKSKKGPNWTIFCYDKDMLDITVLKCWIKLHNNILIQVK